MPWKQLAQNALSSLGYRLINTRTHYSHDGLHSLHHPYFLSDPTFQAAYTRGVAASHGPDPQTHWRVHVALWAARQALAIPGDFVECGVNAGFVSSAILQSLPWTPSPRRFFLIDTFDGPAFHQYSPAETVAGRPHLAHASLAAGAYVTDLSRVQANFAEWPQARIVPGTIPEILPSLDTSEIAFVHIERNCALPEREAFAHFWPLLSPGGIILFDDYVYYGHQANTAALDEVAARLGLKILALPTGQGLVIKPGTGQSPPPALP
ncbi:MAG: class I SAM-dependent methyltransferase [Acidobacteria bacterium]|nr:class I SAM-dependent methyltransferase [Acidobacteriota bacterium]